MTSKVAPFHPGFSLFTLGVLLVLALVAAFVDVPHPAATPGSLNGADVAWMLTATAFVLIMTRACRFFTGVWCGPKTLSVPCCKALWPWALFLYCSIS
ncbi:hypothetical protein [Hymenobacter sp. 5516J-16]|uniref:hypothetical protein n=1 Tax=Hymenobacter sp. 5516J-16 TaxID=2932253 RepID=UPI00293E9FF3|nr:hypothetical protein [Hymenobacter sp. 5516J-16]